MQQRPHFFLSLHRSVLALRARLRDTLLGAVVTKGGCRMITLMLFLLYPIANAEFDHGEGRGYGNRQKVIMDYNYAICERPLIVI